MVELTAQDVDEVASVKELVQRLANYTEENDVEVLDVENLRLLESQLEYLHQALSVVVAQKEMRDGAAKDGGDL